MNISISWYQLGFPRRLLCIRISCISTSDECVFFFSCQMQLSWISSAFLPTIHICQDMACWGFMPINNVLECNIWKPFLSINIITLFEYLFIMVEFLRHSGKCVGLRCCSEFKLPSRYYVHFRFGKAMKHHNLQLSVKSYRYCFSIKFFFCMK